MPLALNERLQSGPTVLSALMTTALSVPLYSLQANYCHSEKCALRWLALMSLLCLESSNPSFWPFRIPPRWKVSASLITQLVVLSISESSQSCVCFGPSWGRMSPGDVPAYSFIKDKCSGSRRLIRSDKEQALRSDNVHSFHDCTRALELFTSDVILLDLGLFTSKVGKK